MKNTIAKLLAGTALAMCAQGAAADGHLEEITVAYFLEWPLPMLEAKASGAYEEALGVDINWVSFETGTAMSAAMASGDVQISVSQGLPPFVVATSAGQELQIIDVAVSYSDNDNCVVREDLEIDAENASELSGRTVAVPLGTAAHYGFLRQMDHFGVDLASLEIVDMAPPEGAAALSQGAVDFACGYGGGLARMKEYGNVLLTGAEKEALGILVFDVTSAPEAFIAENPELVSAFVGVSAAANERWNSGAGGDEMLEVIAAESGMDLEAARGAIATMSFPSTEDQLGATWFDGGMAEFMLGVANVFVDAGSIDSANDSYEDNVNAEPLAATAGN
ncbi:taurine ABC transporter substrate-binding protein [Pontivivens insulae]|uniref:Taurine-binding periplasmic protein n=1 Tax=Pontivivens insulae TaxID=1639689 RepID=A0A2R8A7R9_9RHOB|nr:ABC transporter substrate-binding protein [Pontivivens insulae]RED18364.1 taurine transport system substrate-binding protein [Pontivivens insulae]SPF28262.1 Taurine-binding periplasmic protein [Pontivivens insulae]